MFTNTEGLVFYRERLFSKTMAHDQKNKIKTFMIEINFKSDPELSK